MTLGNQERFLNKTLTKPLIIMENKINSEFNPMTFVYKKIHRCEGCGCHLHKKWFGEVKPVEINKNGELYKYWYCPLCKSDLQL